MDSSNHMKAMVLCAGYGTRLGDLTREVPKPMLPLDGRPLLEYIIAHLSHEGVRQIAVNLHFQPDQITDYFSSGSKWNVQIRYSYEPELLGTAGALRRVEEFLRESECFLVHYGDILNNQPLMPMVKFHKSRNALATMLVHNRPGSNSIVTIDDQDRVTGFVERPNEKERREAASSWVNSGIFVCSPEFLDAIPAQGPSDIPRDVLPLLIPTGRVFSFRLSGYRCAIDSPERLAQARTALAEGVFQTI